LLLIIKRKKYFDNWQYTTIGDDYDESEARGQNHSDN
jgi:hypothetical protein